MSSYTNRLLRLANNDKFDKLFQDVDLHRELLLTTVYVVHYQQHPSLLLHALNVSLCPDVLVQQLDATESTKEKREKQR